MVSVLRGSTVLSMIRIKEEVDFECRKVANGFPTHWNWGMSGAKQEMLKFYDEM